LNIFFIEIPRKVKLLVRKFQANAKYLNYTMKYSGRSLQTTWHKVSRKKKAGSPKRTCLNIRFEKNII